MVPETLETICQNARTGYNMTLGLWDFAWWIHREVNFSPRITQIALIFFYFFSREFALFAVDFGSTMRNPKEP